MTRADPTRPGMPLRAQALIATVAASIAIRLIPFARLAAWMRRRSCPKRRAGAPTGSIAALRRAIEAWSRRLPWRTLCFEQGLAAHWILIWQGYASTLNFGATYDNGELIAHVWVRSGEADVIGCENAGEFVLLSQFTNVSS